MKIIIGAVVAVGIIAGAGTGYAVIKDSDLMCNYDPKSGNYKDPATGEWSAMGTWAVSYTHLTLPPIYSV